VLAGSNITINTDGDVRNFGMLSTSGSLTLSGDDFENGSNATLAAAGDLQLLMDGLFTNDGLIVASEDLTIAAQNVRNNNTLFAGVNMSLYISGGLTNTTGSEIFALENMLIAADASLNHAASLENTSARITAFSGNLDIYADQLVNQREFIEVDEHQFLSSSEVQDQHGGTTCAWGVSCLWWVFREEWHFIDRLIAAAPVAVISAGNDLSIEAVNFVNNAATLAAANNMTLAGNSLINTG
jgi:filamentous hemagglutinin